MHVKSNPQRDLAQVVAHCGCVLLEYNQQPTCQRNGTDPLSIPATGASSQNTSNTTDTRAYAKNETSPTSTSTVDLEDSFRKYTDTVMGVYGSDSIHSSNSDDSTDFYLRGTASPEGVDTILVKGIGSHLEQGDTGNSSDGQLDALSTLQHGENCGFSESLGRKYGKDLDLSTVSFTSSHQSSPNVPSGSHGRPAIIRFSSTRGFSHSPSSYHRQPIQLRFDNKRDRGVLLSTLVPVNQRQEYGKEHQRGPGRS